MAPTPANLTMDSIRKLLIVAAVSTLGLALVVVVLPSMLSNYVLGIGTIVLFTIPGAVALNIVFGLCGQISAGNAAFLAIGAFIAAGMTHTWPDTPTILVLLAAASIGAIAGVLVGAPAVRVRGLLLLVSTLAIHFIVLYLTERYQKNEVGQAGFLLPQFDILGWQPLRTIEWFKTFGVFAILSLLVMGAFRYSRLGRSWLAIRENETAAEVLGVRLMRAKLLAFVISSALIAVQGALFAYYVGILQYETFAFDMVIQYIAIVIIGGLGSIPGTVVGATLVVSLPYLLRSLSENLKGSDGIAGFVDDNIFNIQRFTYGALIVVFLLFFPDGIESIVRRVWQWLLGLFRGRGDDPVAPSEPAEVGA